MLERLKRRFKVWILVGFHGYAIFILIGSLFFVDLSRNELVYLIVMNICGIVVVLRK